MATITNSTELVNVALTRLGEAPISSISGSDDKSTLVANQYEIVRTSVLARRTWRFARKKAKLSKLSAAPVNEYDNAFQLPPDLIHGPFAVYDSESSNVRPVHGWELFGNEILANFDTCVIDYGADVTDVQRWPAYFRELIVLAMCASLAAEITDSDGLTSEFYQRAWGTPQDNYTGGWYRVAAKRDAGTSTPMRFESDDLIAARRG